MSTAEQLKSEDAPPSRRGPVPFGNYLLDELIAVGGMARVYRARLRGALGFEKPLVVKQVRPELAQDPRFVAMFAEEAKTLVRLSHPHIVTVYELGVVDETYFIAMEYVEGVTLHALIENACLSPEFAAHIASQVCDALHHAHERFDLVHRDVTPRNILVDEEGQTRLVDFGIAVPRDGAREDEGGFGSVGYMSPEQLRGTALGPRSDVFSLGCAIHQSLFGEVPFNTKGTKLIRATAPTSDSPFAAHVAAMVSLAASKRPNAREAGRVFRTWLSQNRPEGVAQELGALVSEVRETQSAQAPTDPGKAEAGHTSTTRSIATSPLLPTSGELLDTEAGGTVPLPGRSGRGEVVEDIAAKDIAAKDIAAKDIAAKDIAAKDIAAKDEIPPESPSKSRAGPFLLLLVLPALVFGWLLLQLRGIQYTSTPETPPRTSVETPEDDVDPPQEEVGVQDPEPDIAPTPPPAEITPMNVAATAMRQPPEAVGNALVVFASTPWAEVYIDGRRLGVTPLRERLPRGRHVIRLVNPALGAELSRTIELDGGQTLRLRADFNSSPPAFR
ncbi:MAG: serine/threonine protein kinase [Polyangiales bacterium]|jgi:serine/threonine protein kinase